MKKNVLFKLISIALVALMGASLVGCSSLKESDVSYAAPMVDNILAGIKDKDLGEFTKDMTDTMKSGYTQDTFDNFVSLLQNKIGDLQSKAFDAAAPVTEKNVTYTTVIYKAKYTKETGDVQIRISFDNTKKVAGLYFSSPNLAKQ